MPDTKPISEVAAIIVRGLLAQGVPAYEPETAACSYRGPGNTRCAVGMLIPDDLYSRVLEDYPISRLLARGYLPGIDRTAEPFLCLMQGLHDDWASGLLNGVRVDLKALEERHPEWAADLTPEEKERFIEMVTRPPRL